MRSSSDAACRPRSSSTAGFRDALAIGYQNRPRLFDLRIELPEPLYAEVVEADERAHGRGRSAAAARRGAPRGSISSRLRGRGIGSVAIVLMHGYRYPEHERRAAAVAANAGFDEVVVSHESSPLIRFVSRGDTTVVDAYLTPLLARYVRASSAPGSANGTPTTRAQFMQSNGGLVAPEAFRACNAVLSGPAGGLVATARSRSRALGAG